MTQYQLGDMTVDRLVENVVEDFDPFSFFPDCTEDALAPLRAGLTPRHLNQAGNMILPVQSYVLRTAHHTTLIDSCVGEHKDRPQRPFWHLATDSGYLGKLAALGLAPEDVDFVFCTHLHVDHAGWNTRLVDGRWVPTFPNARYIFAKTEHDYWQAKSAEDPKAFDHGTFVDSVAPVVAAGQADLVDQDHQLNDQIRLIPTPGHTPGHVAVDITSQGRRAVMSGDLMHNAVQCHHPEWSSRACEDPDQSRITRRAFMERFCDTDTLIMTAHFGLPSMGHILPCAEAFRFRCLGED